MALNSKPVKIVILTVTIAIITGFAFCLIPLKEVAYEVTIDYDDVETYYENEPYEDIEVYYENEPYQVTETYEEFVPLKFEANGYVKEETIKQYNQIVIGGFVFKDEVVDVPIQIVCVDLKNTDDVAGTFIVSFSGIIPTFGPSSQTLELSLSPGEVKTAECPADSIIGKWEYTVSAPTKAVETQREIVKYRQVKKERKVIKYREVQKQRPVTRQRSETFYKKVSYLDYLLNY